MLRAARWFKPQKIVVLGDFADFYKVSSHSKDPRRQGGMKGEVDDVNVGLDELDALGAKEKRFIEGNHENRLTRYLQEKAPELFEFVEAPKLFKLAERGWSFTPYRYDTKIGPVHATHECGNAGRQAVFKAIDTYQHSVAIGHTHRMSYVVEGNALGEAHVACSFGWLGDRKQADYMHRIKAARDWALGFGIGYESPKVTYLTPVPIVNYTCMLNGHLFKG